MDKITILQIKSERIDDEARLAHVRDEMALLRTAFDVAFPTVEQAVSDAVRELRGVNEALWEIEDDIRACERDQDFGDRFVRLARSVYVTNDRRAAIKRQINEMLGSRLVEEKSYRPY